MHKFTKFINDFTPAEASFLIRLWGVKNIHIILGTIFDLANKGYFKKIKTEDIFLGTNIEFIKNENTDINKLKKHERLILEILFKKDNQGKIQNLKKLKWRKFKRSILKELKKKGLLKIDFKILDMLLFLNVFIFMCSFFIIVFVKSLFLIFFLFFSFVIILAISYFMPTGFLINKEFSNKAIDFRNTILNSTKTDLEKLIFENPNIFFEILPYAISFNIEKEWIKKFKEINFSINSPLWYETVTPSNNFLTTLEKDIKGILKTLRAMSSAY